MNVTKQQNAKAQKRFSVLSHLQYIHPRIRYWEKTNNIVATALKGKSVGDDANEMRRQNTKVLELKLEV